MLKIADDIALGSCDTRKAKAKLLCGICSIQYALFYLKVCCTVVLQLVGVGVVK